MPGNGHGGCGGRPGETSWSQGQHRAPGRPYVLGLKGQMSEAELHLLRARLRGGVLARARTGELICPLPVGLVYDGAGRVALDPDEGVRHAVAHLSCISAWVQ